MLNRYSQDQNFDVQYMFRPCQAKPSWGLTKISMLSESAAFNYGCWMSQSTAWACCAIANVFHFILWLWVLPVRIIDNFGILRKHVSILLCFSWELLIILVSLETCSYSFVFLVRIIDMLQSRSLGNANDCQYCNKCATLYSFPIIAMITMIEI